MGIIGKLLIIALIFSIGYLTGSNDTPTKEKIIKDIQTLNLTEYIVNETVCITYQQINKTTPIMIPQYQKFTMNLTKSQLNQVLNMRPDSCETTGCSFGYVLAKYDCMDIFGLEHPKFSEKPATGYNPFADTNNKEYYPIKFNNFDKRYFNLSSESWQVINDGTNSTAIYILEV